MSFSYYFIEEYVPNQDSVLLLPQEHQAEPVEEIRTTEVQQGASEQNTNVLDTTKTIRSATTKTSTRLTKPPTTQIIASASDSLVATDSVRVDSSLDTSMISPRIISFNYFDSIDQNFLIQGAINDFSAKPSDLVLSKQSQVITETTNKKVEAFPDWVIIPVLASVLLMAMVRTMFGKYFRTIFRALFDQRVSEKLSADANANFIRASWYLNLNFGILFSLFIYLSIRVFGVSNIFFGGIYDFLILFASLYVLFGLQYLGFYLHSAMLLVTKFHRNYYHEVHIINKVAGVILLPCVMLVIYGSADIQLLTLIFAYSIITLLYIFRIYKGIRIIMQLPILKFYLLLYFCTLEILPILILVKYVISLE